MWQFLGPLFPRQKLTGADLDSLAEWLTTVSNWLVFAAIAATIIVIILGAYSYITSFGNTEKAGRGKTMIYWAVIGMIVTILAKIIINLALDLVSANRPKIQSEKPIELFK